MKKPTHRGDVHPGRLVTVAYLKAQLDSGGDHLGIFMPLLLDVLSIVGTDSFATVDVQQLLAKHHHVAMPQQTVATLLGRATKRSYITRSAGRYSRNPHKPLPTSQVSVDKQTIESRQRTLGDRLRVFAAGKELPVNSSDEALDLLLGFLEHEQVGMLLGAQPVGVATALGRKETAILAAFVVHVLRSDPESTIALRSMLEGLVLYHAAFLPELGQASQRFKDLQVLFDSGLVRQALGYEGVAAQALMRETIAVLQAGGVRCVVLDKKRVQEAYLESQRSEVQAITKDYEGRLAALAVRAESAERDAEEIRRDSTEQERRLALAIDGRARKWARRTAGTFQWLVGVAVIIAAVASLFAQGYGAGWIGHSVAIVVAVVTLLELFGALGHVAHLRTRIEAWLFGHFRSWLRGGELGTALVPQEGVDGRTPSGSPDG